MPNIDTETLCYIIENDLSRSDYEKLLNRPLTLLMNPEDRKVPQFDDNDDDSLIISPSNDLTFLNQCAAQPINLLEEELDRKRRKNQKKKRRRKLKKLGMVNGLQ